MQKYDNTRVVTFAEDYTDKGGRVIYKKGTTHAMHFQTLEKIKSKGAKIKVDALDVKKIEEKAKAAKGK